MSLIVNTNIGSLNAQRSLAASGAELKTAMERLSSGKKINSAADDAAGFAIAERMTAQIRGLNMATKNANDGLSMLAVIENATNDVTDMLQRMRELAIQATNDTNGSVDRAFLQEEVSQLIQEIDRVATQTQYNGQALLDGTFSNKSIQTGVNDGDTISVSVSSIEAKSLGVEYLQVGKVTHFVHYPDSDQTYLESRGAETNFEVLETGSLVTFGENRDQAFEVLDEPNIWEGAGNEGANIAVGHGFDTDGVRHVPELVEGETAVFKVGELSISNLDLSANPQKSLDTITRAIEQLSDQRATYGALQNRLEYTVSNLMNVAEFTTSARSRIEDADFAAESARLAKAQVLQQTGTAMLAQANAQPQLALSLIR